MFLKLLTPPLLPLSPQKNSHWKAAERTITLHYKHPSYHWTLTCIRANFTWSSLVSLNLPALLSFVKLNPRLEATLSLPSQLLQAFLILSISAVRGVQYLELSSSCATQGSLVAKKTVLPRTLWNGFPSAQRSSFPCLWQKGQVVYESPSVVSRIPFYCSPYIHLPTLYKIWKIFNCPKLTISNIVASFLITFIHIYEVTFKKNNTQWIQCFCYQKHWTGNPVQCWESNQGPHAC